MKSVVVEASTVAKAIELAWQKAEKPEEFFIRILQEHSSGFLGFGAQKAKIVFFFKNSKKSDSLFPVVLKQKEYANLFDNDKLKAPSQLNVIDSELNKNIGLSQKKKHFSSPVPQAKQKQVQPSRSSNLDNKPHQHKQNLQNQTVSHVKNQHQVKPQPQVNKTQVSLQLPVKQEVVIQKPVHVKKIEIQSPQVKQAHKTVQVSKVVEPQQEVVAQKVEAVATPQVISAPKIVLKMKRRPLVGADQGVSGITRSVQKKSQTSESSIEITEKLINSTEDKNRQE